RKPYDASSKVRLRSSLSSILDAVIAAPFDHDVHYPGHCAGAAHGSLKPPPTRRLRRAILHLSYSMTLTRLLGTVTSRLSTGRSPLPSLDITTASTGLLCWRDLHPQEWQLASLHPPELTLVSAKERANADFWRSGCIGLSRPPKVGWPYLSPE